MSKVYIVCEPTKKDKGVPVSAVDLTPAVLWGTPVILLPETQSLLDPQTTVDILKSKLALFSDDDYIVPIGDPVLMCMVASIASYANKGRIRYLKWDRRHSVYVPIQVFV